MDANSGDGRNLIDICDIYNMDCLIDKPTRVSQSSQTLIDVILTNNKRRFLSSGVLEPHLSDHSLVYAIMRTSAPPLRSRKILCRSFKNYNRDKFANDLALTPFHVASIFDDVDDQAWAFTKLLTDVIDIHAPVKQFHVICGHVPYMTPQWRRAIRHRNRLWKKYKLDPNTINWNTYKRQRNHCTSLRRKAINYYHHKAENISTKPKEFWKVFGALFHSNVVKLTTLYYWRTTNILLTRNVWPTSSMNTSLT